MQRMNCIDLGALRRTALRRAVASSWLAFVLQADPETCPTRRSACQHSVGPAWRNSGRVAEWFKAAVLKTAVGASPPWVRIPPLPPTRSPSICLCVRAVLSPLGASPSPARHFDEPSERRALHMRRRRTIGDVPERVAQSRHRSELAVDLIGSRAKHVPGKARRAVRTEHVADLAQHEARSLGHCDQFELQEHVRRKLAAKATPRDRRNQSDLIIIAECGNRSSASRDDVSDIQKFHA